MDDSSSAREYQILALPSLNSRRDTVSNYELELTRLQQDKGETNRAQESTLEKGEDLEFGGKANETPDDEWRDVPAGIEKVDSVPGEAPPALVLQKLETSQFSKKLSCPMCKRVFKRL